MKKTTFLFIALTLLFSNSYAQVTKIRGLAVIVDYNDKQISASDATIDSLLNQKTGYTKAGNKGSLYEFFKDQSNGKYGVTHQVVRIKFNKNSDYFNLRATNPETGLAWDWGQAFADSILERVKQKYPNGFSGLTRYNNEPNGGIGSWLVIPAHGGGVAFGVGSGKSIISDGQSIPMNHIGLAGIGNGTETSHTLNTIAHEAGHSIFRYPDYYFRKPDNPEHIGNVGAFCLMGSGGSGVYPQQMCGHLLVGLQAVTLINIQDNIEQTIKIKSNDRAKLYRYVNPKNPKEYFLFEAYNTDKWYPVVNGDGYIMDKGLAIWHVVEGSYHRSPWVRLVQADKVDEMNAGPYNHKDARGCDLLDLFGNAEKSVNGESNPLLRWRDGHCSGLYITSISAPADSMSFTVQHRDYTITSNINGVNGTSSPLGIISATNGTSKTFTFNAEMGYEINEVLVDGISQGNISSYTFNNVTGNHTISVSFKSVISVLPDPWARKEFGGSTTGKSDFINGACKIETNGLGISTTDNFHFVYQPLTTNGEIVARVESMNQPDPWTKVGLMIRESLSATTRYALMMKTAANGLATQFRNGSTVSAIKSDKTLAINQWLKLKRVGTSFTFYYSANGVDWILFDTQTVNMTTGTVYVGLFVTGATSTAKAIATFDNVKLTLEDANTFFSASADNVLSGSTVTYTDLSTNAPTSWKWTFYGASTATSSVKNPVVNYVVPGVYPVSLVTTNAQGVSTLSKTLSITVQSVGTLISPYAPTASWTLKSVDSEETVAENGAAKNAFDGDTKTYWHTKYQGGAPAYPHEIVINMGKVYDLTGVGYLPRIGGAETNGRIKIFDVYASADGVTWPAAASYIIRVTGTDDAVEKTYGFPSVKAQYLKLIGRNACNGSSFAGAAEIRAYGTLSVTNAVIDATKQEIEIYTIAHQLRINMADVNSAKLYVYDVLGKLLVNKKLSSGLNSFTLKSGSGVYLVKIVNNNQTLSKKVML